MLESWSKMSFSGTFRTLNIATSFPEYKNKQNINPACACPIYLINIIILFYPFKRKQFLSLCFIACERECWWMTSCSTCFSLSVPIKSWYLKPMRCQGQIRLFLYLVLRCQGQICLFLCLVLRWTCSTWDHISTFPFTWRRLIDIDKM
jgi:hypothetical protein